MNTSLIKLFNVALPEDKLDFQIVNSKAGLLGYIVHPDACTSSVMEFLNDQTINPNTTFYKELNDVISKSRLELWLDQVLHYCSTYVTDFTFGNGYVPNTGVEQESYDFAYYKVIVPITKADLYARCINMLTSGIALKQDTMHAVADFVIDYVKENKLTINVDTIKNREALVYICDALQIAPNDKFNLLRYIIYKTTGQEMIIKNDSLISAIRCAGDNYQFDFSILTEKQMKGLASIFLRYKEIFLAFKHDLKDKSNNAPYINKLRKMAKKYHEPIKESFWQTVFSKPKSIHELRDHLDEITNFKKIALMQTCMERSMGNANQLYLIRNGKTYLRENFIPANSDFKYLALVYSVLYESVLETLQDHAIKFETTADENGAIDESARPMKARVIKGLSVALPTSEKNFIGNYPFGTSYKMEGHNFVGCYWRNEWGTHDFDLSYISVDGHKYGWNSNYYNKDNSVIYSGDMTNADPEAAEVIYMSNKAPIGIVKVNQYNGQSHSKFQFFFGQAVQSPFTGCSYGRGYSHDHVGHIVNPGDIKIQFEVPVNNQPEMQIGVTTGDELVLMALHTGNSIVSSDKPKYAEMMQNAILTKAKCFIKAEDMLKDAGFEIVDESYKGEVDIDFANLDKDSFIALLN
jgi:hypothetical protein